MSAIAAKVGYSDGASFGSAFRAETGVTPWQYRSAHKKNTNSQSAEEPRETFATAPLGSASPDKDLQQEPADPLSTQVPETTESATENNHSVKSVFKRPSEDTIFALAVLVTIRDMFRQIATIADEVLVARDIAKSKDDIACKTPDILRQSQ